MKENCMEKSRSLVLSSGRPPSPASIDFEIQRVAGGDSSTIQLRKLPSKRMGATVQERIGELEEEIQQLNREKVYRTNLISEVLVNLMPKVHVHVQGLLDTLQEHDVSIVQAWTDGGKAAEAVEKKYTA